MAGAVTSTSHAVLRRREQKDIVVASAAVLVQ
jgi:hypothetical protein